MMITFQRQIESVGLHRALISRASVSDFTQTAAAAGGRGRGRRRRRRVTRRQTRRAKATPSALGAPGKQ